MTLISKLTTAAALTAMLAFAAPANAQGKKSSKSKAKVTAKSTKSKAKTDAKTKLPKAKNYDFLADDIDGERVLPNHDRILGVSSTTHGSLIRLRVHFIDEILRSAEML